MTADAASGRAGLWKEPEYPGDFVRALWLKRGTTEFGAVAIQRWEKTIRVGTFLPGVRDLSSATPRISPDKSEYFLDANPADNLFDSYVQDAYAEGWQNVY
jgi:hypothetical protein